MKKLLIAVMALIPALSFAQQVTPMQGNKTAQQAAESRQVEKTQSVNVQPAATPVILTEKEQHAVWLKENADLQKMSRAELSLVIEQNESKLTRAAGSDEKQLANLRREIKWMKEILSAK